MPWFVNKDQVLFAGNLLLIAFVSYFGAKLHRPRIIALGCTILSFGCLLISFPHFLFGRWVFCLAHSSFCGPYLPYSITSPTEIVLLIERDTAEHGYDMIIVEQLVLFFFWNGFGSQSSLPEESHPSAGHLALPLPCRAFILVLPLVWTFWRNSGLWYCHITLLALICLDGQYKMIFKDVFGLEPGWQIIPDHCVGKAFTDHNDSLTTFSLFLLGLTK